MSFKLGFIGAGAMAEAILKGVLTSGLYKAQEIIVSDINMQRLDDLRDTLGIATTVKNRDICLQSEIIILAIKPHQITTILKEEKGYIDNCKILVSIAAGIHTSSIQDIVGQIAVVRVMPNTPALVGAGMSAICQGTYAQNTHLQLVEKIFSAVGETVVINEDLMDGVTGVSGSGPAYVYQFIEAMADGGVQVGLPRPVAYQLAAQTVIGAGIMVLKTGEHPGVLKDMVTSPGGTTIRALNVLKKAGVRGAIMDAVEASYLWSNKLGNEKNKRC